MRWKFSAGPRNPRPLSPFRPLRQGVELAPRAADAVFAIDPVRLADAVQFFTRHRGQVDRVARVNRSHTSIRSHTWDPGRVRHFRLHCTVPAAGARTLSHAGLWTMPFGAAFIVGSMLTPAIARHARPAYVTFVVYALGLAPVFTLATDIIVSSAPPERAGAASAISETGSEFGGARHRDSWQCGHGSVSPCDLRWGPAGDSAPCGRRRVRHAWPVRWPSPGSCRKIWALSSSRLPALRSATRWN